MGAPEGSNNAIINDQVMEFPDNMNHPSQLRLDRLIQRFLTFLPPPLIPFPSDSDTDDYFSLTSYDSNAGGLAKIAHHVLALAATDGEDHFNRLPDELLSNIVSRLPTKDAARTTVLASRWRHLWASIPLLVDDAHLLPADDPSKRSVVRAIASAMAAHPGPVRSLRVTHVPFLKHELGLQSLLKRSASKNLEDLVLVNRLWPLAMELPSELLGCASLRRLYLGVWAFPDAASLSPAFTGLRELGLIHTVTQEGDLDAVLGNCPRLEILSIVMGYDSPACVCIGSRSLRAMVVWLSDLDKVIVEDAPCLERLLFHSIEDKKFVKIVGAPKLEVFGYLDLSLHVLQIGDSVIKAGMEVKACNMVPSVKILAVNVQFGLDHEAKMLPTLLKCFPGLEKLYIMSNSSGSLDVASDTEFWQYLGSCECLESHLKTVVYEGYGGQDHELEFIRYINRRAMVLNDMRISWDYESSSREVLENHLSPAFLGENIARRGCRRTIRMVFSNLFSRRWSFHSAIDLSLDDPFYALRLDTAG